MELWEYIVIVLSVEILIVIVVLIVVWNYCRWSQTKKRESEIDKPPIIMIPTITEDDIVNDLFSRDAQVEYGKPPSNPGSIRYSNPKMERHKLAVVEESPPTYQRYRMSSELSFRNSPEVTQSDISTAALKVSIASPVHSLQSSTDSGVRVVEVESPTPSRRGSPYNYSTGSKPRSGTINTRPHMRSSPLPDVDDTSNDGEADEEQPDRARVRFETLWLMKRRKERMSAHSTD